MTKLIASKIVGKSTLVELYVDCGRYIISAPNYLSGWLPSDLSMIDALEWFDSTTLESLNSVGEY